MNSISYYTGGLVLTSGFSSKRPFLDQLLKIQMNFPMKPLFQSDLRAADIVLLPGMSRIIADSMLEPQDPT